MPFYYSAEGIRRQLRRSMTVIAMDCNSLMAEGMASPPPTQTSVCSCICGKFGLWFPSFALQMERREKDCLFTRRQNRWKNLDHVIRSTGWLITLSDRHDRSIRPQRADVEPATTKRGHRCATTSYIVTVVRLWAFSVEISPYAASCLYPFVSTNLMSLTIAG